MATASRLHLAAPVVAIGAGRSRFSELLGVAVTYAGSSAVRSRRWRVAVSALCQ
jgi:hypothetical protein